MPNKLALAPGFYYIRSRESMPRDLVNPGTDGQQLYVASSTTDLSHQWQITGHGVIRSMDVGGTGRFAFANLSSSSVPQAVIRSNMNVEWIIGVSPPSVSNEHQGTIIANDTSKRGIALNGNNVELVAESSSDIWAFVPV